jgi:Spy/CpxP family protein refolding chaperone
MPWNVKPWFLLLSLALNVAFIVSFASHALFASSTPAVKPQAAGDCCTELKQKIGATDLQWEKLQPKLAEFRENCGQICREICERRQELIDLVAEPGANPDAIRTKQNQILTGQRQIQELIVEHLLSTKEFLTPQQQKSLFNLIRSRCGCSAANCEKPTSSREGSGDCCDS